MSHESPIFIFFSFYHDPPPTDLYTLSLHDALPILPVAHPHVDGKPRAEPPPHGSGLRLGELANRRAAADAGVARRDLREELGRDGAPAAHVEQVRLDLVEARRSAVRSEERRVGKECGCRGAGGP